MHHRKHVFNDMDRFAQPTAADEIAPCNGACGLSYHHAYLNEDGLCDECKPTKKETKNDNRSPTDD